MIWRRRCLQYSMRNVLGYLLAVTIPLLLTMVGCGPATAPETKTKPAKPPAVRLVQAESGKLPRLVTVTGTLAADEEVVTAFKMAGRISEIAVDLGSLVSKDQVMARLDPTDYRLRAEQSEAALRQIRARLGLAPEGTEEVVDPEQTAPVREARAVLNEARLNQDRLARMYQQDYISRAELDAAVSRMLVAEGRYQASLEDIRDRQGLLAQRKSELALARQQLADTVLKAPIDGAVRERRASTGEYLAPGAPVATLVRIHPLRMKVAAPEREAAAIRIGQTVRVRVEGDSGTYSGRVVRVSPVIEKQSRTLTVEAEIENRQGRLRPGSFATAEILVAAEQTAVLIPAVAIVTFAGIEKVIGVKDGRAVERRIRTGRRTANKVEILEGLAPGDSVVAEPGNLSGGQPVTVSP
ncbi:MAG: efflux RND transporter periplasmic adaptor subunit [Deltaproteobacteria bacterium]|nr:efflux RND transporter periplasmic adaptor subunit [Deltaproteobacteria bacterium]